MNQIFTLSRRCASLSVCVEKHSKNKNEKQMRDVLCAPYLYPCWTFDVTVIENCFFDLGMEGYHYFT